eukprot:4323177-Lingulodinium_polyedra.AAC.1
MARVGVAPPSFVVFRRAGPAGDGHTALVRDSASARRMVPLRVARVGVQSAVGPAARFSRATRRP